MEWRRPTPAELWRAVEIYLAQGYAGTAPSAATRNRLEQLRTAGDDALYDSPAFERDSPESPAKYLLRLGNRFYPHMKLVIERSPDGAGHLFRADTHDRHIRPAPGSREYTAFTELMQQNQKLAEQIETAWEQAGLPTFKRYLREDLARRRAAGR